MLAIYVRFSKEDKESNSIDHQLQQANEYKAKLPEYTNNFKIYNEGEGLSGTKDRTKRPELNELINGIESGLITSVWMRKQDRLARSGKVAIDFAEMVKENNIYLFFGDKGHCDLNDYMVYFQFGIMAMVDELKPKAQSVETKKSLRRNADAGLVHGIIPYGYKSKKMIPHIIKKQAENINKIYDLYLKGYGTFKIANYLNERNVPTKLNKKNSYWGTSSITNILKNNWYNGKRTYRGIEYDVPRIVDEVKHHKVQMALESRKNTKIDYTPTNNILLRSLIICNKCGRKYQGRVDNNKHFKTYLCNSNRSPTNKCGSENVSMTKLDSFIIKHLFSNRNLFNQLQEMQNSNDVANQLKVDIDTTTTKLTKMDARVIKYAKLLGGELEDDDVIMTQYINAKKQKTTLNNSLIELKTKLANSNNSEVLNKYNYIYNQFDVNADFNTIQLAVHSMIENITLKSNLDMDNNLYYLIKINYRGFNESSMFAVQRPYKTWMYLSDTTTQPTPEEIQDDIDALKYAYGEYPDGKQFKEKDVKQDFYTTTILENITLDKSELIDFNKQPRI